MHVSVDEERGFHGPERGQEMRASWRAGEVVKVVGSRGVGD